MDACAGARLSLAGELSEDVGAYQLERQDGVAVLVRERSKEEDGEVVRWRGEWAEDKGQHLRNGAW